MKQKTRLLLTTVLALTVAFSLGLSMTFSAFAATEEVTKDGNYVGRAFNADYDKMIEDFAVSQPASQANYVDDGVLQVAYNGDENSYSMDGAIYKIASSTASTTTPWPYTHLVYEMSSPDGSATISDLAIYLREVGDASTSDAIDLADVLDPTSATEIGTAKTAIALDLMTYVNDAELTSLTNGGLAGYHLVAKAGCTGTLVIHDVYLANLDNDEVPAFGANGTKTLADFEKDAGTDQKVDDTIYWCGSEIGQVIPKHISLNDSEYTLAAGAADYENIALTVRGTGALTVANVAWNELKGPDGNALPQINGENFTTYVINLAGSGLATSENAVKLTATGAIEVKNAFLTNMEVADAEIQQVPFIDASTAERVDDFAYANKTPLGGDYDAAFADTANADAGVQYRLSYSNADKLSIANGMLTIDATNLGDGYVNYKTQSVKTITGYEYFVLKVKGEDGASLDGFRFGLGTDGNAPQIVWGNGGLKADTNLIIPALGASPYKTADGWEYVVVDIAASGLGCGNTVDMYYSGAGKLYIDEMFYCNGLDRGVSYNTSIFNSEAEIVINPTEYVYNYIGGGNPQRYLTFEAKGENGAKMDELRIEFEGAGGVYWFGENAAGVLLGADGKMLPALTEEYQTYVIDLAKTGVDWQAITNIHLHATLKEGKITIKNAGFATLKINEANSKYPAYNTESTYTITQADGAYQYVTYAYFGNNVALNRYLAITVKGDQGIMDNELRFEFEGAPAKFWKDNDQLLLDPQGAPLGEITEEYQTFYIDLDAIGIPRTAQYFHIHSTANTTASLTIAKIGFATADLYDYETLAMPTFDTVKPQVEINVPATAQAGDSIKVEYTASDDVTATENLQVTIGVVFGGTPVELTGDTFVCEEGTYVVTVTVTDEEGNANSAEATITVTAKSSEPTTPGTSDEGCNSAIGGGTIGLVLLGVAIVALRKKERE